MNTLTSFTSFRCLPLALALAVGLLAGCKKDKEVPTPAPAVPVMTDIDGNVYQTITVGGVVWTSENLRTTRYKDGSAIATGLTDAAWGGTTTSNIGAFAIYNDVAANNPVYGKLYNWAAVNTGRLAPAGWHVPSQAEWSTLVSALGGFSVAGGKLKSTSTLWNAPNTGANNSSGFGGLPGGYRGTSGNYAAQGNTGYWWASSERNTTQGDYTSLDNSFASSFSNGATKSFGYSVRCVRD